MRWVPRPPHLTRLGGFAVCIPPQVLRSPAHGICAHAASIPTVIAVVIIMTPKDLTGYDASYLLLAFSPWGTSEAKVWHQCLFIFCPNANIASLHMLLILQCQKIKRAQFYFAGMLNLPTCSCFEGHWRQPDVFSLKDACCVPHTLVWHPSNWKVFQGVLPPANLPRVQLKLNHHRA